MRRHYTPLHMHEKPFINSYHICEVPLPYYNPLQDPHLRGYFSGRKVARHINDMGLIYSPRKEYPYFERRTKNMHKHLKPNLCKVPPENLVSHPEFQKRSYLAQSHHEFGRDKGVSRLELSKRRAGSQMLARTGSKWSQLNEILANKRPESFGKPKRNFSPDIRSKSHNFERRNFSGRKRSVENIEEQELIS